MEVGGKKAAMASRPGPLRRRSTRSESVGPYRSSTGLTKYMSGTSISFDGEEAVEPPATGTTIRRRPKRSVGFSAEAIKLRLDNEGVGRICGDPTCAAGCGSCEASLPLRLSDHGCYYPEASVSDDQKRHRQLSKLPEGEQDSSAHWWDALDSMCHCSKGCGARCPCARDGIGCWFELCEADDGSRLDWGCACKGKCASHVPGYVCDISALKRSRQQRLRELQASPE